MLKALIIEDEIDICYLLSAILKGKRLEVNYVNALSEAVLALEEHKPEIIFLDNHMPDGLGIDFIRYLKSTNSEMKVVMMTAFDNHSDRLKAIDQGVDAFIAKPFTKQLIYQTLEKLVQQEPSLT